MSEENQVNETVAGEVEQVTCNLLNDVEQAIVLVKQLKTVLAASHPSVTSLVKKLLFTA